MRSTAPIASRWIHNRNRIAWIRSRPGTRSSAGWTRAVSREKIDPSDPETWPKVPSTDNDDSSKDTSFDGWDDSSDGNSSGFLSFKRSSEVYNTLESGRVDETIKEAQEMAAIRAQEGAVVKTPSEQSKFRLLPYSRSSSSSLSSSRENIERNMKAYEGLKLELTLVALGAAVLGTLTAYFLFDRDTTLSYALGAFGSVLYVRLLIRGVDSMGGGQPSGLAGGQLFIPILIVVGATGYNRLHASIDNDVHIEILPLLLGFFTYNATRLWQLQKVIRGKDNSGFEI